MSIINSRLGVGPMSSEIIEAVFRFSDKEGEPLMLIASKNQIDWDRGYVNNWSTAEYMEYIKKMRRIYSASQVYICRDHCGPGFKNDNLEDVYKTIDSDIENGFDLIHIDFCLFKGSRNDILNESKKAIEYIHKKNPNILIEVGTDENSGDFLDDANRIEREMNFFSGLKNIVFYVVQTGSLIREINQVGDFNKDFIKKIKKISDRYDLKLKEHNADYLDRNGIRLRKGLVDALNVAPQYGVLQTILTIQKAVEYGIDFDDFLRDSYSSRKWKKWMYKNNADNKFLCSLIAGHYNFSGNSYKNIYKEINEHEDFKKKIMKIMAENFRVYMKNL